MQARPLIAMIGDQYSTYQKPIVASMHRLLKRSGYGLLYACGGALRPTADWDSSRPVSRNAIYTLARDFPVAGFVVLSSAVGNHADATQLAEFAQRFTHKPIVCLGSSVANLSCVSMDNYALVTQLMNHMTQDPSRRRFVFIRGYANSPNSQSREAAFRNALNKHQIAIDESLFIDGSFQGVDAYYAMDKLLKRTHDIHAVVAANDVMAQSAIHALTKHGLRIPEDVIVSGFDNRSETASSGPSLTSVKYSMDSFCGLAVESLLTQIKSGIFLSADNTTVCPPAQLVIRGSTEPALLPTRRHVPTPRVFEAMEFRESLLRSLKNLETPDGLDPEIVVSDVVSMLVNGADYSGTRLHTALLELHNRPAHIYWWRHLLQQLTTNLQLHGSEGLSADALAHTASILGQIQTTIWNVENAIKLENERHFESVNRMQSSLNRVNNMGELLTVLKSTPSQSTVNAWFICLYKQSGNQPDEMARLLYQYPPNSSLDTDTLFPSADVLPGDYLQYNIVGSLILEPLCAGSSHLGYIVVDAKKEQHYTRSNLTAIADIIANVLWRLLNEH
ncbi:LacI family DNA-binding transcriptional regulator [Granulosicoccus antarcticus]|nr:substrate-binding domain-containing protein [Granulosicoccus antarcticus]